MQIEVVEERHYRKYTTGYECQQPDRYTAAPHKEKAELKTFVGKNGGWTEEEVLISVKRDRFAY